MSLALDYAPREQRRRVAPLTVGMLAAAAGLTAGSVAVFWLGAEQEPYSAFRKVDALVQVGLGTTLIALWVLWCVSATLLVYHRRQRPAMLGLLVWAVINVLYLANGVNGFLDDIAANRWDWMVSVW